MWRICTRALAAAQPDNLFSICFRVTCCHKVTHFSTDLPQLSTYVINYLNKVLRCKSRVIRSVNFLLTDTVYCLMQIKPIRTSPSHPETDGLVERFKGTLKAMLQKAAVGEGKDWDKLLPFVLWYMGDK